MKKLLFTILILGFVISSFTLANRYYTYAGTDEPIECNGDKVEYFEQEKKVVGSGNVVIKYQEKTLTADKVTVWTETKNADAEGNVKLTEGENVFEGEKAVYNFENNTGTFTNFKGYAPPWYVKGKIAERLSEEEFMVKKGYATTCDEDPPHWRLSADKVLIRPKKILTTYNAMMWFDPLPGAGNIPSMWVPYYCHPLDDDRPHVTIIPGKNQEWGLYMLTAWRYNLTPNQNGYFHIDYRERKDIATGLDYIYDTGFLGKGNLKTYYMDERNLEWDHIYDRPRYMLENKYDEKDPGSTREEEKALFRLRHQWEAGPNNLITAELYKYRNESLLKDYFFEEYEKDINPASYVLLANNNPIGNLTVLTRKRANRFEGTTEALPEAKLNVNSRRIGASNFYYGGEFSGVNFHTVSPRHTDENPGEIADPVDNTRYDTYNSLSYNTKLGFLYVTPSISTRQTYFKRMVDSDESQIRGVFSSGVNVYTKFFKIFRAKAAPLGIEINDLRHIITPTLNYGHAPLPTMPSEKVSQFDSIDSITRANGISLSLENKLQTKRGKDFKSVDLAMLLVETAYNFNHTPGGQLSNYTAKLELRPFDWLVATSNATMDPHTRYHHKWLKQLDNDISLSFGDKGSVGFGHRYVESSSSILLHAKLDCIPGWSINIYEDYTLLGERLGVKKKRDLKEQEYKITKSLHCWDMDLRYAVTRYEGEEIMVIFRLKAFPDIPFEFGRDYHKPKVGSQYSG